MANVIGIAPLQAPSFNGDISGNCGLLLGPQTTPTSNVYKISASSASGSTSITVSGNLDLTKLSSCSISGEGIQPDTTVISSTYNSPNTVLVLSNPTTSALTSVNTVNITEVENSNITFFSSASSSSDAQIVVTSNTSSENSGQLSIVSGSIKTTATTIDFTSGTTGVLVPTVASDDNSTKAASTAFVNTARIQKETVVISATEDGQSTYTVTGGYSSDKIDVYLNGLYLVQNTDYTASDGSTIVLNDVLATEVLTDSTVTVVMYSSFSVSDTVSPSELSSALESYVLSTGGTVSGSLMFTNGNMYIQGPTTGVSQIHLETGTVDSWTIQRDSNNDLSISRYDTTGTLVDNPLSIDTSTGIVNFNSSPTAPTPSLTDSSTKVATTEFVTKNKINRNINSITATTAGQSTFLVPNGYNVINLDVFYNGYYLVQNMDYTAADGSNIVLSADIASNVSVGDVITTLSSSSIDISNAVNSEYVQTMFSNFLPKGFIAPYYGSISDLDSSIWAYCDGTNGTPDLRNQYLVGTASSTTATGTTTGSSADYALSTDGHALTVAEMPSHSHNVYYNIQGTYSGNQWVVGGSTSYTQTSAVGGNEEHSHTMTLARDSLNPASVIIHYIMKIV